MTRGVVSSRRTLRRTVDRNPATITGIARLGRRTKALAPTLAPGAIVILDHPDLDTVAARAVLAAQPLAVIDNQPFVTGRYPNRGPQALIEAGIPLFEVGPGDDLFSRLKDGERVVIDGDVLRHARGAMVTTLRPLTNEALLARLASARENLDVELTGFAENTLRYLARAEERRLLLDPIDLPEIRTTLAGRHVLVVVRGDGYEADLQRLGAYLREQRPAVIAVDGAADALLAVGIRPDIVLGDMDSVSDTALKGKSELIVHAYPQLGDDGHPNAPGLKRVEALGLGATVFPVAGTSEDAALLLAYEKGADLIVAVGTHSHLEDFLDKGRGGMASTFLVRLKVGSRLVDARGVSRLYGSRTRVGPLFCFLTLAALFPIVVLIASAPMGQLLWRSVLIWWRLLWH